MPQFDLLVLAGDLLDLASSVDLDVQEVVVQKYLRRYAAERTLLVASGNHDIESAPDGVERAAHWMDRLHGADLKPDYSSYERGGALFSMCPWWDGPQSLAKTEALLASDAVKPRRWWIWLHHNPPAATPVAWTGRKDGGDAVVRKWIERFQPDLVFSGHIHNAPYYAEGGWHTRIGKTWIFNPGKQPGGEPTRIVVDLAAGRASWFSTEGVEEIELGASA